MFERNTNNETLLRASKGNRNHSNSQCFFTHKDKEDCFVFSRYILRFQDVLSLNCRKNHLTSLFFVGTAETDSLIHSCTL